MGIYIAEKRVVRDGVLVAFAGEVMAEEEARRRGILAGAAPVPAEPEPVEGQAAEPEGDKPAEVPEGIKAMTVAQLREYIKANGGEAPHDAAKADLQQIAAAL